jgi:hypothetical protein
LGFDIDQIMIKLSRKLDLMHFTVSCADERQAGGDIRTALKEVPGLDKVTRKTSHASDFCAFLRSSVENPE